MNGYIVLSYQRIEESEQYSRITFFLNCHHNSVHIRRQMVTEYCDSVLIDTSLPHQSNLDVTNYEKFVIYK
jgi:hypothetical protein